MRRPWLWTERNTWFSSEAGRKGQIKAGQLADLVVLDRDYFAAPDEEIARITSVLTLLGGEPVHGAGGFQGLAPPLPPAMPDWSPVNRFGGYQRAAAAAGPRMAAACGCGRACAVHGHDHGRTAAAPVREADLAGFWGSLGCSCWMV